MVAVFTTALVVAFIAAAVGVAVAPFAALITITVTVAPIAAVLIQHFGGYSCYSSYLAATSWPNLDR